MNWEYLPLREAQCCLDCDSISRANGACPACGSRSLMPVSRALGGSLGHLEALPVIPGPRARAVPARGLWRAFWNRWASRKRQKAPLGDRAPIPLLQGIGVSNERPTLEELDCLETIADHNCNGSTATHVSVLCDDCDLRSCADSVEVACKSCKRPHKGIAVWDRQ